jgi:hypothetical protein
VQFAAALLAIPLKDGEADLYDRLSLLFGYVFLTHDDYNDFALKQTVTEAYKALRHDIKSHVANVSRGENGGASALGSYGVHLIRRLLKAGKTVDEVTNIVISSASALVANHIQQVSPHDLD